MHKKRTDGRYQKNILLGKDENGYPIRKVVYARTLRELEAKVFEAKRGYSPLPPPSPPSPIPSPPIQPPPQAVPSPPAPSCPYTFKEWAIKWLDEHKVGKAYNTYRKYQSIIHTHLLPAFGNRNLADIQPSDAEALLIAQQSLSHVHTALEIHTTMNQIFEKARLHKVIPENPLRGLERPRPKPALKRAFTEDEIDIILTAPFTIKQKAFVMTLLRTGLRRGEALALNKSDVDLEKRTLRVEKTAINKKGGVEIKEEPKSFAGNRTIPLTSDLIDILKEYFESEPFRKDILFASGGEYMTSSAYRTFWRHIQDVLFEAGFTNTRISAHWFRHEYATTLCQAGADLKTAQTMLGHASAMITANLYTHVKDTAVDDAREKLNQYVVKNVVIGT